MNEKEFIENIRQEIREDGFITAIKLTSVVVIRAKEFKVDCNLLEVIEQLPCDDIRIMEYATWLTKDRRRKDLYYFIPPPNPDID